VIWRTARRRARIGQLGELDFQLRVDPKIGCDLDKQTARRTIRLAKHEGGHADADYCSGSIPKTRATAALLRVDAAVREQRLLYLAWERVQAPNGTTNMDFELNQSSVMSANNTTPVRTAGDILIKYDLSKGGNQPTLGFLKWVTSGTPSTYVRRRTRSPVGARQRLLSGVASAINLTGNDPILAPGQSSSRSLDALTVWRGVHRPADGGHFHRRWCVSFGQAYLKSRSSEAFSSEIKDFIAPIRCPSPTVRRCL
jgi:hypothetical protein